MPQSPQAVLIFFAPMADFARSVSYPKAETLAACLVPVTLLLMVVLITPKFTCDTSALGGAVLSAVKHGGGATLTAELMP